MVHLVDEVVTGTELVLVVTVGREKRLQEADEGRQRRDHIGETSLEKELILWGILGFGEDISSGKQFELQ